jgi:HK97 family phage prohead protease
LDLQELIYKNIDFEVKAVDPSTGHFSGLANGTEIVDTYGDIVHDGAFKRTIKQHKGKVPVLKGHDSQREIGMTLDLEENGEHGQGLGVRDAAMYIDDANPRNEIPDAREELIRMRRRSELGRPMGISIGFTIPKGKAEFDQESGVRHIYEVALWEISTTPFPANQASFVDGVKSLTQLPGMARRIADGCNGPLCPQNKQAVETTITTLQSLLRQQPTALPKGDSARGAGGLDKLLSDPDVLHSLKSLRNHIPTSVGRQ